MIFAKCFAIAWMLGWFFTIIRHLVDRLNKPQGSLTAFILTLIFAWSLLGLLPVLIVKFGWEFIK